MGDMLMITHITPIRYIVCVIMHAHVYVCIYVCVMYTCTCIMYTVCIWMMDGWMDRWMDRWMDLRTCVYVCRPTHIWI